MRVDSHVGQVIGASIFLAPNMLELNVWKLASKAHHLRMELLQLRLLGLVLAGDLFDHELGVQIYLQPIRLPVLGGFQSLDQRVVLSLVVRRYPQPPVQRSKSKALIVFDQNSDAGRSGVASRRAIRAQPQCFQAITRMRPQFSQYTTPSPLRSACIPEVVTVT